MKAICTTKFYDSEKSLLFEEGQTYDINTEEITQKGLANYFMLPEKPVKAEVKEDKAVEAAIATEVKTKKK